VALTTSPQDKKDLLADIISSYINIDIRTLADFRNQEHIYNLMKMLAARAGTKLDHSKLSRLSGVSRPTIINYVDFLEKTYLITRLHIIAKRPDREIVKAKKVYLCDNGILNTLADVSSGVKFENAIFNQLRHHGELSYYSLKNGREIDFIVEGKTGYEAKESPTAPDKQALEELAKQAEVPHAYLVGRTAVPRFEDYIWGGEIR
jgi:predicted AAA+ superfamily ATPase